MLIKKGTPTSAIILAKSKWHCAYYFCIYTEFVMELLITAFAIVGGDSSLVGVMGTLDPG